LESLGRRVEVEGLAWSRVESRGDYVEVVLGEVSHGDALGAHQVSDRVLKPLSSHLARRLWRARTP